MHARYMISLLVLFIKGLNGTVTFTSPTQNETWTVGQTQSISWTQITAADNPNGDYLSVRLYQVFPNDTVTAHFEYLMQQAVPDTVTVNPAGWPVQLDPTVGINSSVSNTYILALYLETQINVLAQSDIFTIINTTAPSSASTTTSSSARSTFITSTSDSSTSSGTSDISWSAAQTSFSAAATSQTVQGGLSSGPKAGIAIGVTAAVILGLALGWFLFGRRKRQDQEIPSTIVSPYCEKQVNWQAPALSSSDYNAGPQNQHMNSQSGVVPMTYAELPELSGS